MHSRGPLFLVSACVLVIGVSGHSRLNCPEPRSPETSLKSGPCGTADDDGADYFAATDAIEVSPGPFTISWQESISHIGAPWRISLSGDGDDLNDVCILVDHVPHNDLSDPQFDNEETWTLYNLTITIPDVDCAKCSIHIANPMTDKIAEAKYYDGVGCCDPNDGVTCSDSTTPAACSSVYHSCSVPLRITGSTPRSEYTCPGSPKNWPSTWDGTSDPEQDPPPSVDVTAYNVYRQESGTWVDRQLQDVDSEYREQAGICYQDTQNKNNKMPNSGLQEDVVLSFSAIVLILGVVMS